MNKWKQKKSKFECVQVMISFSWPIFLKGLFVWFTLSDLFEFIFFNVDIFPAHKLRQGLESRTGHLSLDQAYTVAFAVLTKIGHIYLSLLLQFLGSFTFKNLIGKWIHYYFGHTNLIAWSGPYIGILRSKWLKYEKIRIFIEK